MQKDYNSTHWKKLNIFENMSKNFSSNEYVKAAQGDIVMIEGEQETLLLWWNN